MATFYDTSIILFVNSLLILLWQLWEIFLNKEHFSNFYNCIENAYLKGYFQINYCRSFVNDKFIYVHRSL